MDGVLIQPRCLLSYRARNDCITRLLSDRVSRTSLKYPLTCELQRRRQVRTAHDKASVLHQHGIKHLIEMAGPGRSGCRATAAGFGTILWFLAPNARWLELGIERPGFLGAGLECRDPGSKRGRQVPISVRMAGKLLGRCSVPTSGCRLVVGDTVKFAPIRTKPGEVRRPKRQQAHRSHRLTMLRETSILLGLFASLHPVSNIDSWSWYSQVLSSHAIAFWL